VIEKWNSKKPVTAVYFDGEKDDYYVKRFLVDDTDKKTLFISENEKSLLELVSTDFITVIDLTFAKVRGKDQKSNEVVNLQEFIAVKGLKALGNKLSYDKLKNIDRLSNEAAAEVLGIALEEVEKDPFAEEKKEEVAESSDEKEESSDDSTDDNENEAESEEKGETPSAKKDNGGSTPQMDLFGE
jgi:topoisomerase-4 subunit A